MRESSRYLLVGREGAARPDPVQAAWLYAQMVRWGQAPLSDASLAVAMGVFRPDLYDAATGKTAEQAPQVADGVGAFAGPPLTRRPSPNTSIRFRSGGAKRSCLDIDAAV